MSFGISSTNQKILLDIFNHQLPKNSKVIIYGSRIKGNYTSRSDVDLVLKNSQFNSHQLAKLLDEITQSSFPYLCDIQLLETINNPQLIDHIQRLGQLLYQKPSK